jgi:NTP pyrophosphatase (non-canonical NTP hydrolase)
MGLTRANKAYLLITKIKQFRLKRRQVLSEFGQAVASYYKDFANPNPEYFPIKLMEECGEVAEAYIACNMGSKRKVDKMAAKGVTPREALIEELADTLIITLGLAISQKISYKELAVAGIKKLMERTASKTTSIKNVSSN